MEREMRAEVLPGHFEGIVVETDASGQKIVVNPGTYVEPPSHLNDRLDRIEAKLDRILTLLLDRGR